MEAAESKYSKYIVTQMKNITEEPPWIPGSPIAGNGHQGRILFLDGEVIPGAFYVETVWEYPQPDAPPRLPVAAHTHDYDEVLGFFGTDLNDPYNLNGEIEFWIGDEQFMLTKSCLILVPKGVSHCPLVVHRADKPIFEFTTFAGQVYG